MTRPPLDLQLSAPPSAYPWEQYGRPTSPNGALFGERDNSCFVCVFLRLESHGLFVACDNTCATHASRRPCKRFSLGLIMQCTVESFLAAHLHVRPTQQLQLLVCGLIRSHLSSFEYARARPRIVCALDRNAPHLLTPSVMAASRMAVGHIHEGVTPQLMTLHASDATNRPNAANTPC